MRHLLQLLLSVVASCIVMASPNSPAKTQWGAGLSQNDLMEKDTVLVVDNADQLIGSASKKESHVFSKETPYGILHRAFSVFLFDQKGRLLLQQRASSKITFPNVSGLLIDDTLCLLGPREA